MYDIVANARLPNRSYYCQVSGAIGSPMAADWQINLSLRIYSCLYRLVLAIHVLLLLLLLFLLLDRDVWRLETGTLSSSYICNWGRLLIQLQLVDRLVTANF